MAELEQEVGGLTKDLASMREKVTAQATLITKLEDDVSRAGTTSESAAPFSNDDVINRPISILLSALILASSLYQLKGMLPFIVCVCVCVCVCHRV